MQHTPPPPSTFLPPSLPLLGPSPSPSYLHPLLTWPAEGKISIFICFFAGYVSLPPSCSYPRAPFSPQLYSPPPPSRFSLSLVLSFFFLFLLLLSPSYFHLPLLTAPRRRASARPTERERVENDKTDREGKWECEGRRVERGKGSKRRRLLRRRRRRRRRRPRRSVRAFPWPQARERETEKEGDGSRSRKDRKGEKDGERERRASASLCSAADCINQSRGRAHIRNWDSRGRPPSRANARFRESGRKRTVTGECTLRGRREATRRTSNKARKHVPAT